MAVFQGDFGAGIATGNGIFSDAGFNPCRIDGPVPIPGVTPTGSGYVLPKARVGQEINGDFGTDWVYCKLVLNAPTDLIPGQAYQLDERFTATLLSAVNANNLLNSEVVVLNVLASQLAAGTYYGWFARAGHLSLYAAAGSVAGGQAETSAAVAGQMKFLNNHTAGQKTISPTMAYGASSGVTFNATMQNGSQYLTGVANPNGVLTPIEDLQIGQTITCGTAGFPAGGALIWSIDRINGLWRIGLGTPTAGSLNVPQLATASGPITCTVTSHVQGNFYWPTLSNQN